MGTDDGLEASYPLVFLDASRVKIRDEGLVRHRSLPRRPGRWDELWIENTEGASASMNEGWDRLRQDIADLPPLALAV
jgi:hypothetical protein